MSKVVDTYRPMRSLSRLLSRCLRTRTGLTSGARVLAVLTAAAMLVGVQATAGLARAGSAERDVVAALSAPLSALHSAPSYRVSFGPRSASRSPDHLAAALPACPYHGVRAVPASRSVTSDAIEQPRAPIVTRGYDATAPPVLS